MEIWKLSSYIPLFAILVLWEFLWGLRGRVSFSDYVKLLRQRRWYGIVLTLLGIGIILLVALNKEGFHWYFDIATGKPVDHYSTYPLCLTAGILVLLAGAVGTGFSFFPSKDKK